MLDLMPIQTYALLVFMVVVVTIVLSTLFPSQKSAPEKFMPYESGNRTETHLLEQRFPLRHYLVGLMFLVFDIEVVFLYPWAVVGKSLGAFAFGEMLLFSAILSAGFLYVWRKGGLQWD